jgi:hypothetical protein
VQIRITTGFSVVGFMQLDLLPFADTKALEHTLPAVSPLETSQEHKPNEWHTLSRGEVGPQSLGNGFSTQSIFASIILNL